MPPQKEFTYDGKVPISTHNKIFVLLGILGSTISLLGLINMPAQLYFVAGSSLLLLTALHFKLVYFIALELILIAGHGAILLGIGATLQLAIPILLCVQLLFFYFLSGQLNNLFILIGIAGIALLSIGLSYENQWIFFSGGSAVACYAFYNASDKRVSLIWAVLNCLFALIAILKIILS